jgi:hypothetical protein
MIASNSAGSTVIASTSPPPNSHFQVLKARKNMQFLKTSKKGRGEEGQKKEKMFTSLHQASERG